MPSWIFLFKGYHGHFGQNFESAKRLSFTLVMAKQPFKDVSNCFLPYLEISDVDGRHLGFCSKGLVKILSV